MKWVHWGLRDLPSCLVPRVTITVKWNRTIEAIPYTKYTKSILQLLVYPKLKKSRKNLHFAYFLSCYLLENSKKFEKGQTLPRCTGSCLPPTWAKDVGHVGCEYALRAVEVLALAGRRFHQRVLLIGPNDRFGNRPDFQVRKFSITCIIWVFPKTVKKQHVIR